MRVLFDIVHPADVLFFAHPIRDLLAAGDSVRIVSRKKDIACDLLDQFGFEHQPISQASQGRLGLAQELLVRDLNLLRTALAFRPDVMAGFGGVSISHIGKLIGCPSISFYDTDTAPLQTRLTWPFITHLYVPEAFTGAVPEGRTTRFRGIKETSYFHPENFVVDETIASRNGWVAGKDNFFLRVVRWRANHDIGKSGWTDELLRAVVEKLSRRGVVHISTERPLPSEFEPFIYRGNKSEMHHVLGKCRLYVGESASMAQESGILGVPSIYDAADHAGATCELEDHGLLVANRQRGQDALLAEIDRLLDAEYPRELAARRAVYLADRPNLAKLVLEAIQKHGSPSGKGPN
jgi:predicted glycosyltransferase